MILVLAALVGALHAPSFPITVESIMRGPALVGAPPSELKWSASGQKLYFRWAKADGTDQPRTQTYAVNRDGTGLAQIGGIPAEDRLPENTDRFGELVVYESGGEIDLFDTAKKERRRVVALQDRVSHPRFVDSGKAIVFERGGNLYRCDLAGGNLLQLTDIHPDPTTLPPPSTPNPNEVSLAEESGRLFKNLPTPRKALPGLSSEPKKVGAPISIALATGQVVDGLEPSPDGQFVSVVIGQTQPGGRQTFVPDYVTSSGYTEELPSYRKVGGAQTRDKLSVVNLQTGASVDWSPSRPGRIEAVKWSPDGARVVAWAFAEDHKDGWIIGVEPRAGKTVALWNEHDDAWIGGPGLGLLGFTPGSDRIYFQSERTGFAHLLTVAPDGSDVKDLTPGNFEVSRVRVDREHNRFLFVSDEDGPAKRSLNTMPLTGGPAKRLADLSADDASAYAIAPNGDDIAVVRSTANRPPELFLGGRQITVTPTEEWLSYPWIAPPIVTFKDRDGLDVAAHLFKPANWKKGGPAVLFVHGAGYLQNVYDGWSYYYREYMFHHLLMDHGYMVLDMDYRGSAGYGKAWRTAIYRHMGGKDLDDEVDGAQWLTSEYGVDPKRIGIYGGSYGGFLTLMAMFTTPDVFAAGAALRPVSDWANYNHGYTSEILNLPQNDREAYELSSPIYHAEGLKGALLICHGMVDTNVHFQDSVRLVERLIELGKSNWEVAPYPIEDHAFRRPESWTDEYRRIFNLFERTIGGRAQAL